MPLSQSDLQGFSADVCRLHRLLSYSRLRLPLSPSGRWFAFVAFLVDSPLASGTLSLVPGTLWPLAPTSSALGAFFSLVLRSLLLSLDPLLQAPQIARFPFLSVMVSDSHQCVAVGLLLWSPSSLSLWLLEISSMLSRFAFLVLCRDRQILVVCLMRLLCRCRF